MLKAKLITILSLCALPLALASCQGNPDTDIFFSETISDLDEKAQEYRYLVENCDPKKSLVLKVDEGGGHLLTYPYEKPLEQCILCLGTINPIVIKSHVKAASFDSDLKPYSFQSTVPSSYSFLLVFYIDDSQSPIMELTICNETYNRWAVRFRKCVYSITVEEYERVASAIDSIFENLSVSVSDDAAKQDGRWSPSDQSEFRWKGALPC